MLPREKHGVVDPKLKVRVYWSGKKATLMLY